MRSARLLLLAPVLVLPAAVASAQDGGTPPPSPLCPAAAIGCSTTDLDWAWHDALFSAVDLDSGWVPPGSPIQLHFALHLAGMTDLAMGGTAVTSWPTPLTLGLEGRAGTGTIAVDYGYELVAQLRFSLDVAGAHYAWMGDIPIPGGVPRSVRLHGMTTFDPFVLPMASPRPVLLTSSTARFTVFRYDAIGSFVSVPGVSGGAGVDLIGAMTTAYRTDRIVVAGATAVTAEHGTTRLLPATGDDYGPSVDVTAHPEGTVDYSGTILAYPDLYLDIAGRHFTYDLATIPLSIAGTTSNAVFPDERAHVPLPDVGLVPTRLDLGDADVGATTEQLLDLPNLGEAALVVTPRPLSAPFSAPVATLVIPPRSTERLPLDFAPLAAGPAATTLFLDTNDPDHPLVVVALRGNGLEPPPPPDLGAPPVDAGPPPVDAGVHAVSAGGGCCGVAGTSRVPAPAALAALPVLLALRRRARRALS